MYLSDFCRFLLCTCGWERRGERGAWSGGGAKGRGIEGILYGYCSARDWDRIRITWGNPQSGGSEICASLKGPL